MWFQSYKGYCIHGQGDKVKVTIGSYYHNVKSLHAAKLLITKHIGGTPSCGQ